MEWQNYNHLFYFYKVASEGGVSRAAEKLRLAQSTISAQIKYLEENLGEKLFGKQGRNLALTETGKIVLKYCEDIFSLGQEMRETLRGRPSGKTIQLRVGITDSIPKLVAYQLLEPAYKAHHPLYLLTREDHLDNLLNLQAKHELDLVLSNNPLPAHFPLKAFSHLLGQSKLAIFGCKALKSKLKGSFPQQLNGMPFLLPGKLNLLRKELEQWFSEHSVHPLFVGEFDDTALMKVFAQGGKGFMAAPVVLEKELKSKFDLHKIELIKGMTEKFYAITIERKIKHPAVLAISESAKNKLD